MICPNQSNRGPLKEKKKELKCGSLPTADIVGAVGKIDLIGQNGYSFSYLWPLIEWNQVKYPKQHLLFFILFPSVIRRIQMMAIRSSGGSKWVVIMVLCKILSSWNNLHSYQDHLHFLVIFIYEFVLISNDVLGLNYLIVIKLYNACVELLNWDYLLE